MALPATGTTPSAGGYLDVDNRYQGGHRTGLIAVAFRDARGADTDISPHNANGTAKWSPLAQDGKLRDDLFAEKRVNGFLVPNTTTNEGWYLAGAFGEGNGPSEKPSISTDEQMIEQSNWPFESDIMKQDEPFTFQALQNLQPAIARLIKNLPLSAANGDSLVEVPGAPSATGWSQVLESVKIGRQFLLYGIRHRNGKYLYEVDAYDFATLNNVGERQRGKKGKAAELTFKPEPSGFFMAMVDGEYKPIIKHTFVGGEAWGALYGSPVSQYLVTLGSPTAGNFKLGLQGGALSGDITYNAPTAAAVKSALVAVDDGYGSADWTVTGSNGGPFTVTTPAGRVLVGDGSGLTGGTFSVAPINP